LQGRSVTFLQIRKISVDEGEPLRRHDIRMWRDRPVGQRLDASAIVFLDERPAHLSA
jgi:hypothetical protein